MTEIANSKQVRYTDGSYSREVEEQPQTTLEWNAALEAAARKFKGGYGVMVTPSYIREVIRSLKRKTGTKYVKRWGKIYE